MARYVKSSSGFHSPFYGLAELGLPVGGLSSFGIPGFQSKLGIINLKKEVFNGILKHKIIC